MQEDTVLRIPLCTRQQIEACSDGLSSHKVIEQRGDNLFDYKRVKDGDSERVQLICEVAVPGACPRVQCYSESMKEYRPCRMLGFIQSQTNESGFWMKLPCSQCEEKRNLHTTTRGFIYE